MCSVRACRGTLLNIEKFVAKIKKKSAIQYGMIDFTLILRSSNLECSPMLIRK